jgi:beta-glucanase (GH16 family)
VAILLGQDTAGVDGANSNADGTAFAQKLTALASGTVDRVWIKVGAGGLPTTISFAIYADGGTDPSTRLTAQVTATGFVAGQWNSFPLSPGLAVTSGTVYWIAWVGVGAGFNYTNFAATGGTERDKTGGTLPAPWGTGTGSNANIANVYGESLDAGAARSPLGDMLRQGGGPRARALQLLRRRVTGEPALATLTDTFTTLDTARWTASGTVVITGGQLDITPGADPNYAYWGSDQRYSLIGSSGHVEVPQIAIGDSSVDTEYRLCFDGILTGTNRVSVIVEGSTIYFQSKIAGVNDNTTLAYDAFDHRWWKITEEYGFVKWWTSPNGTSWTLRKTKAWAGFSLDSLQVALLSGWWSGGAAPTQHALFDNFNSATVQSTIALTPASLSFASTVAGPPQPLGLAGGWNMVFSDEFNGTDLDTAKWITNVEWYGGIGLNDSVAPQVSGGQIHLLAKDAGGGNYTGQIAQTGVYGDPTPFSFTYGFVESRVKIPLGLGLWPAVWLVGDGSDQGTEIDLGEWLGDTTSDIWMTVHYSVGQGGGFTQTVYTGTDWHAGYHTIGVNWQPGSVVWYIDGLERYRVTDSRVPATAMYCALDHWVTDIHGPPTDPSIFPADFQVEYLRVWQ